MGSAIPSVYSPKASARRNRKGLIRKSPTIASPQSLRRPCARSIIVRHQKTNRKDKMPNKMPNTMLETLETKVLYEIMRIVWTTRKRMMIHIKIRRKRTCALAVLVSDQNLAYSPGLRQFRDFQEPTSVVSSWSMIMKWVVR